MVNDETSMRNPDSSLGIYLTAAKLAQRIIVAENKREKQEAKKERAKKTFTESYISNISDVNLFRNPKTP